MTQPPIIKTMDDMLAKLRDATRIYREAEKAVAEYTTAIRALAQVCEDEETRARYLVALEELGGKPGFLDAIRFALKGQQKPLTPTEIRTRIALYKRMDLSGYSNPMASIHTTLRRMKESGEIEEIRNDRGEKAYGLALPVSDPAHPIHDPGPIAKVTTKLKPQERFSLSQTKPVKRD